MAKLKKNRERLFFIVIIFCSEIMSAEGIQIGDLYYELDGYNKTAKVTYSCVRRWTGSTGLHLCALNEEWDIEIANIPDSIMYNTTSYRVTRIGSRAFTSCKKLRVVTIPNSVKEIEYEAFANCKNLISVIIHSDVTHIDKDAFNDCPNILIYTASNVDIPNIPPHRIKRYSPYDWQLYHSSFSVYAKNYVEKGVNEWQQKGEFEKTIDWEKRVNEQTRKRKIETLIVDAERKYVGFWEQIYQLNLQIHKYDADNEVYMLSDSELGSLLIKVPFNEARDFKQNWHSARLTPKYFIENDKLALASLDIFFPSQDKHYSYSNQASLTYEMAQVDYHFGPIQIPIDNTNSKGQQTINQRKIAIGKSDVDLNIPNAQEQNNNTLVLILANENYHSMPQVPYAINDGNIFKEYCTKTLGIPEENILYQSNATLNGIRQKIDLLQKKAQARANARKETNIIVYYTGHGVPDINTRGAYLMPTDGYEENISTGYKLDDLYQQLGNLPAKSITVFLDACFSGVNRNDEALAQSKGARLVAKSGMPVGNMVVFAASQGNQTAFVNDKEQHGLFTYYLLKKLQESKGDVTLDVLANYLTSEVNLKSLDLHEKEQIPSIIASPQVQNQWQNWKLK